MGYIYNMLIILESYTSHWNKQQEEKKEEKNKKSVVPRADAAYGWQLIPFLKNWHISDVDN